MLNGTGTQYGIYSNVSGGASNWAAYFAAGDVFVAENVGIGTSAPHAPLQFGTGLTNRKIVLFEAANNDHEFFGFGINGGLLRYQANGHHVFYTASSSTTSTELMRITSSGNVGIGTPSPSASLDVAGTFKLEDGSQGTGHVLTSIDMNGNATWKAPVNFGVNSCVMGIPAGTTTGLIFDILEYDNGGNFNVGTGQFKAPETGVYHVDASVAFDASSNYEIQIQILVNGGTYKRVTFYADPSNTTTTAYISADVYVPINNTVSIGIYQNSGGVITPASGGAVSAVYFNGHLVR